LLRFSIGDPPPAYEQNMPPHPKTRQAGCETHATLRKQITSFLELLPDGSTEGDEVFLI
jgi:hypothetical protein